MDNASQYALAYALSTTAGVRPLLSLAALSIAIHVHAVAPPESFAWLASNGSLWILVACAIVEIVADKVPFLDHAIHVIQVAVKPAAAAVLVGGTVHPPSHVALVALMVAGALAALGVHGAIASMRGASTATTAGLANPVVSTAEDAGSIGALALSFFAPIVAAVVAACFMLSIFFAGKAAYRRFRTAR
jgi:hypothetical protein